MPIFDQGYQHWKGPLSGRVWRWLSIARNGVRVQAKNRFIRLLLLVAWMPAFGLVGVMVMWGLAERQVESMAALLQFLQLGEVLQNPQAYRATMWTLMYSFFFKIEIILIMLLVAFAGPGLISQDLRFNALPMYLARPLTRLDYFLGKLGVIGALVAWCALGPAVFAYVVGLCFCLDWSVFKDTYPILLGSIAYGLIVTLSVGTFILALSSLTRRSLYVGITWAGLWIISSIVGTILTALHAESVRHQAWRTEQSRWLDEHPPPPGAQMSSYVSGDRQWRYPVLKPNPKTGRYQLAGLRPDQEKEGERWLNEWNQAQFEAIQKGQAEQGAAMRGDWRLICSYVANLERMADLLLDTDSAWVRIGQVIERARQAAFRAVPFGRGMPRPMPAGNEREIADRLVLNYPWWWSAVVLAGLLGLSTCILTRRVKSLDRLK